MKWTLAYIYKLQYLIVLGIYIFIRSRRYTIKFCMNQAGFYQQLEQCLSNLGWGPHLCHLYLASDNQKLPLAKSMLIVHIIFSCHLLQNQCSSSVLYFRALLQKKSLQNKSTHHLLRSNIYKFLYPKMSFEFIYKLSFNYWFNFGILLICLPLLSSFLFFEMSWWYVPLSFLHNDCDFSLFYKKSKFPKGYPNNK